jgi:hypothetical protein
LIRSKPGIEFAEEIRTAGRVIGKHERAASLAPRRRVHGSHPDVESTERAAETANSRMPTRDRVAMLEGKEV